MSTRAVYARPRSSLDPRYAPSRTLGPAVTNPRISALTTRRETTRWPSTLIPSRFSANSLFPYSRNTMTSPSAAVKAEPLRGGALRPQP